MRFVSKTLITLFIASSVLSTPLLAQVDTVKTSTKKTDKKISTSTKRKNAPIKIVETKGNISDDAGTNSEIDADLKLSSQLEYKCELGNSVTLYSIENNDQYINMRWKNRFYKLNRVNTTTGAYRYENEKAGLVWINIPSKGLLLDSLRGRQLANECKSDATVLVS